MDSPAVFTFFLILAALPLNVSANLFALSWIFFLVSAPLSGANKIPRRLPTAKPTPAAIRILLLFSTHNIKHVIDYIPGNFEESSEAEFHKTMTPYLQNWKIVQQKKVMNQIDEAMGCKKLAVGINQVWKAAGEKRGRLLVVEKNFIFPAQHGSSPEVIYNNDDLVQKPFYIKDAVDDIIEKVLASGGDVEFVDEGILKYFSKIALIEYF